VLNDDLDDFTPAYQSRQSTHRTPNAKHLQTTFGTHLVLMEHPAPGHTWFRSKPESVSRGRFRSEALEVPLAKSSE
jgi:hypothetical protein